MPNTLLFVNGTLMQGLELHTNLEDAPFLGVADTATCYRLHSINDRHPGMYRIDHGGVAVRGELYLLPEAVLARVLASEPRGLYLGTVELADGRTVSGILYPRELAAGHPDISVFGDWRAYRGRSDPSRR